MSKDTLSQERRPQIGDMSKPRYLRKRLIKDIGIEAYTLGGNIQTFFWLENRSTGGIKGIEDKTHSLAAFVARVKLVTGTDVAIGLPIDEDKSDPMTGHVEIKETDDCFGIYTSSKMRILPPLLTDIGTEAQLRHKYPLKFEEFYQKARAVLPRLQQRPSPLFNGN